VAVHQVRVEVSRLLAGMLSPDDLELIVSVAIWDAEALPCWRGGQVYRHHFTLDGRGYSIALAYEQEGYHAVIGLSRKTVPETKENAHATAGGPR